uniref:SFRICE042066.2 n=1 Tax=Spodoptera frugiperda TaxID=7108 RepID=A0A2H1WWV0_SPOFR
MQVTSPPQLTFSLQTDNYLDQSFQRVLFPFRCLQHALFQSRFSIKHNFIKPHNRSYYIFSFFGTLCLFFYIYYFSVVIKNIDSTIEFFFKTNSYLPFIPFLIFYVLNIIQRNDHVKLVITIQKSFRLIKFNCKQYKECALWNWFGVFCHLFWVIFGLLFFQEIVLAIMFYVVAFHDVSLTYGISMIFLIKNGMVAWIAEVEYQCGNCLELEDRKRCEVFKKLFVAYEELMEAYVIFKRLFKISVSNFSSSVSLTSLYHKDIVCD